MPSTPSTTQRTCQYQREAERGSVSALVILMATTVLVMVGLAVDAGGQVHALQEARSIAREAARVGGQQLQVPTAVRGHGAVADPERAAAAADAYLSAAGVSGSTTVTGPTAIRVDVTTTYDTKFLSVVGISSLSGTGQATSRITRSVDGVEQ